MDLEYIKALEKSMIHAGVKVPLSFNDVSLCPDVSSPTG